MKRKYLLYSVILLWVILAVVFAFTDFQISRYFVNYHSEWALFLDEWGGYPGAMGYIFSFLVLLICCIPYFKKKGAKYPDLIIFSKTTLFLAIGNVLCFVGLTKFFWGRVRFYNLDADFSQYTPWFLPQGPNGNESFTSGHAAEGWLLLPVGFMLCHNKNPLFRSVIITLTITWGLAVSLSRVRIGAHYASDVLFSSCFGIIMFILLYNYYYPPSGPTLMK